MRFQKQFLCLAIGAFVGISGIAGALASTTNGIEQSRMIVVPMLERINSMQLDPARAYMQNEEQLLAAFYLRPLQYDYSNKGHSLMPLAASSLPQIQYLDHKQRIVTGLNRDKVDYTRITLSFKTNLKYHPDKLIFPKENGYTRTIKANDFAYQIKRIADPSLKSPFYEFFTSIVGFKELHNKLVNVRDRKGSQEYIDLNNFNIPGIKVLPGNKLQLTFYGVKPQAKYYLAMPMFSAVPPEAYRFYSLHLKYSLLNHPVYSGAYLLGERSKNKIILIPNPTYSFTYNGKKLPLNNGFVFKYVAPDNAITYREINTKGFDMVDVHSSTPIKGFFGVEHNKIHLNENVNKTWTLTEWRSATFDFLGFNLSHKYLGKGTPNTLEIRKAIKLALNKKAFLSSDNFDLQFEAIDAPIPYGIYGSGLSMRDNRAMSERLVEARKLLEKYKKPLYVDLYFPKFHEASKFTQWIATSLSRIGIKTSVHFVPPVEYGKNVSSGKYAFFASDWGMDYPDPQDSLALFYSKNINKKGQGINLTNFSNPEYDNLYNQIVITPNNAKRQDLIKRAVDELNKNVPAIFLFQNKYTVAHKKAIKGFSPLWYGLDFNQYMTKK